MTFFYDLNKRLADIDARQQLNEARHPQELDYQQGPEDDAEYRRHHSLDDPDRRRERKLRATDHRTLDRLERQAVQRGKQIDEEPNEGNEFAGELAKARASGAKQFRVDGKTYPVKGRDVDEGRNDPSPLDDPITRFRKRHAPSVMKDPKGREELSKLDTEYGERRKTGYGRGEDEDDEDNDGQKKAKPAGEKRGRGRPKGSKRAIGAKGPTGRSKLMTREERMDESHYEVGDKVTCKQSGMPGEIIKLDKSHGAPDEKYYTFRREDGKVMKKSAEDLRSVANEDYDRDEYDEEGEMAQSQARTIEDAAQELQAILDADENLPEWVQKKITLAMDYIDTARDYLAANRPEDQGMEESALQAHIGKKKYGDSGMKALQKAGREGASKDKMARIRAQHDKLDEVDLEEKAVSKAQRRAAGIAHAARKGDVPRSELRGASKEMAKMAGGELKKFAKTKEKGLPAKKTEEVEETTTAGNVATGGDAPAKGGKKGGMQFGKGIYDSMNRELEAMISESMNVSVNMNSEGPNGPTKSVTVTATDEDADMLAALLTRSGLGGGMSTQDDGYGHAEQVDENEPDYPTDPVVSDDALQYAGGLNKPKSTGQTTTPIIANQDEREVAYDDDGDALRRMREMAGVAEAKGTKPDFLDMDKDGDKTEPMTKAVKDKEEKVDESVERGLWSLWQRIQ
jgi:hypothetical protein